MYSLFRRRSTQRYIYSLTEMEWIIEVSTSRRVPEIIKQQPKIFISNTITLLTLFVHYPPPTSSSPPHSVCNVTSHKLTLSYRELWILWFLSYRGLWILWFLSYRELWILWFLSYRGLWILGFLSYGGLWNPLQHISTIAAQWLQFGLPRLNKGHPRHFTLYSLWGCTPSPGRPPSPASQCLTVG